MKNLAIVFFALLFLAVSWSLGYRTGSLDEGYKNRAEIRRLHADLDSYSEAFQKMSDERVRLIIKSNRG